MSGGFYLQILTNCLLKRCCFYEKFRDLNEYFGGPEIDRNFSTVIRCNSTVFKTDDITCFIFIFLAGKLYTATGEKNVTYLFKERVMQKL